MQPSDAASLSERLRARTERERQEIEATIANELLLLAGNLKAQSADVLSFIESDIRTIAERITAPLKTIEQRVRWSAYGLLAMASIAGLGLLSGALAWSQWKLFQLSAAQAQTERLRTEAESAQKALAQIEAKIGMVRLQDSPQGVFLLLPPNADQTLWKCGGQPCIRVR